MCHELFFHKSAQHWAPPAPPNMFQSRHRTWFTTGCLSRRGDVYTPPTSFLKEEVVDGGICFLLVTTEVPQLNTGCLRVLESKVQCRSPWAQGQVLAGPGPRGGSRRPSPLRLLQLLAVACIPWLLAPRSASSKLAVRCVLTQLRASHCSWWHITFSCSRDESPSKTDVSLVSVFEGPL